MDVQHNKSISILWDLGECQNYGLTECDAVSSGRLISILHSSTAW